MKLEAGKVALVTGAASGIGLALSERFARDGLHVVLAGVNQSTLASAAEKIGALGVETLVVPTDVSDPGRLRHWRAPLLSASGRCTSCVTTPVWQAAPTHGSARFLRGSGFWASTFGCDPRDPSFLPILIDQGEGHIVDTASIDGLNPGSGPVYAASKHAVVALSEGSSRRRRGLAFPSGSASCPGLGPTAIMDADRNWPARLGGLRRGHRRTRCCGPIRAGNRRGNGPSCYCRSRCRGHRF